MYVLKAPKLDILADTGDDCLPEFGCTSNIHCVVNNTKCDVPNKNCVCDDGSLPNRGEPIVSFYKIHSSGLGYFLQLVN